MKLVIRDRNRRPRRRGEETMSLKALTTEQLQDDLAATARAWPDGIPPQQTDRINAIKSELKRRGESAVGAPRDENRQRTLSDMSDDQLTEELRKLSNRLSQNQADDDAQERFANVRFELRRRMKKSDPPQGEPMSPTRSPLPPRALEIPQDVVSQDATLPTAPIQERAIAPKAERLGPESVCSYAADVGGRGIILKYTAQGAYNSIVQVASSMSFEEAEEFVHMVQDAVFAAKRPT